MRIVAEFPYLSKSRLPSMTVCRFRNSFPFFLTLRRISMNSMDWSPFLQCSATCGVGEAQRNVGCRAENGSLVDHSHCAGQERPSSIQQCVERPCPTEPPTTTTTTTTEEPLLTTEHPSVAIGPVTSAPIEALAGYRPQSIEIHIDPTLNSINGGSNGWNSESNDVPAAQPRIYGTWRAGSWGQVCFRGFRPEELSLTVCFLIPVFRYLRWRDADAQRRLL